MLDPHGHRQQVLGGVHQLHNGLHLFLVVDICVGVQHVSEVLKIILILLIKNLGRNDVRHDKKIFSITT